ncbi:leukocyte elastase inhibitor [Galendromus occidentalis]|uniref:Leukocyte elastase inhibitor n=1 Tax=Galendromus occidentalis TaxID=34638 RepID=A0AAJ6VUR6_9ACAR|nr:leukocyte elastase inhibitor [Galendromus occidentalis]
MRLFICVSVYWTLTLASPVEVQVQGRYRPQGQSAVTPMSNITNYLGFMIFKGLPDDDKIVSPVSLMEVLFMLYFGTKDRTKDELDELMQFARFGLNDEEHIESDIIYQIRKWKNTKGEIMDLTRAYSAEDIYEPYMQRLNSMFDADISKVDFLKSSHMVTETINKWISEKTSGNIDKFFKEDLDVYTKLVLISIITFKFHWKDPFHAGMSREGLFNNKDKEQAYATFMYKENDVEIGFNEVAHSVTVKLPYENTDYDMYIIGPWGKNGENDSSVEDIEQFLNQTKGFDALLATDKKPNGTIGIEVPRFVVSSEVDVKGSLAELGVKTLFTPQANLQRMSAGGLHVSGIRQAGYAKIDEQGTEAGVVTAATASSRMVPTRLKNTVTFNKPFLFTIRNNKLNLDLFMGKVTNPPKNVL